MSKYFSLKTPTTTPWDSAPSLSATELLLTITWSPLSGIHQMKSAEKSCWRDVKLSPRTCLPFTKTFDFTDFITFNNLDNIHKAQMKYLMSNILEKVHKSTNAEKINLEM